MATGERIRFFRNRRGMTMKYLGQAVGFPENSADVRISQYESETRVPKEDMTESLAYVLDVSPQAISVPDIDSYIGLMHTLFTLEDRYGLIIEEQEGDFSFHIDPTQGLFAKNIHSMLKAWAEQATKLKAGEITKEEYDKWRYRYPEFDTTRHWVKTIPKSISDEFVKEFRKKHPKR
jgi:transcriptional regulator with XRE-family HTH domain